MKTRAMAVFQNKKNPVFGINCVFKIMKTPVIASVSTDANVVYGSSLNWRKKKFKKIRNNQMMTAVEIYVNLDPVYDRCFTWKKPGPTN